MTSPIQSGMRLTPERLNRMVPLYATVTMDQPLDSNSATLQTVNDLVLPLDALATYEWQMQIAYNAGTTADIKIGWSMPAGTLLDAYMWGLDTNLVLTQQVALTLTSGSSRSWGGAGVGFTRFAAGSGILRTAASAGQLRTTAAQNTATVEIETIKAGSYISLRRVS